MYIYIHSIIAEQGLEYNSAHTVFPLGCKFGFEFLVSESLWPMLAVGLVYDFKIFLLAIFTCSITILLGNPMLFWPLKTVWTKNDIILDFTVSIAYIPIFAPWVNPIAPCMFMCFRQMKFAKGYHHWNHCHSEIYCIVTPRVSPLFFTSPLNLQISQSVSRFCMPNQMYGVVWTYIPQSHDCDHYVRFKMPVWISPIFEQNSLPNCWLIDPNWPSEVPNGWFSVNPHRCWRFTYFVANSFNPKWLMLSSFGIPMSEGPSMSQHSCFYVFFSPSWWQQ